MMCGVLDQGDACARVHAPKVASGSSVDVVDRRKSSEAERAAGQANTDIKKPMRHYSLIF